MSQNKVLLKIISILTASVMSLCICSYTAAAEDDFPEDTMIEEFDENADDTSEENIEEDGFEENDSQAIAGAFNDEHEVTIPAKQIKIKSGSFKVIGLGSSFQIVTSFKPSNSDDTITYKSLNKTIAQVTNEGLVTGVGIGQTTIRLKTSTGVKANITVTVTDAYSGSGGSENLKVESIDIVDSNIMVRKNKTASVEYVLYPLGSSDKVNFSSEDPDIASINSKGVITGKSEGTTTITLTTSSGIKASCSVTVYSGVYKGIDVSKWQGDINWKKVSNAGIDFAMIRSSFGDSNVDVKLKENVKGCEKYGIPYGFYHYTYARNVSEAKKEARFFLKTIKKYNPEYPVVLDIEESFYDSMSKKQVTDIICAFMEELENAGYYAMIYSYANFFKDNTTISRLEKYDIWVACWGDTDKLNSSYDYHYGMWQYSSTGKVDGISGEVDLDYAYKDYAGRIRKYGLNNLK